MLRRIASATPAFRIRTSGLGVFTTVVHPVIYITVVRDQVLSDFHQRVWQEVEEVSTGAVVHYHPERWIPHITLAQGDLVRGHLPEIVSLLSERDFAWEIEVGNLSLIYDNGVKQGVEVSLNLEAVREQRVEQH